MKKKVTTPEQAPVVEKTEPTTFEISDVSAYYVYGKGNADEYARALNGIKEELRELAYGERQAQEEVPTAPIKRRRNGAVIAVIIISLLFIVSFVVGYFLPNGFVDFIGETPNLTTIEAVAAELLFLWGAPVCMLVTFIIALFRVKRQTGSLLKIFATLAFLLVAAMVVMRFVGGGMPGIGLWIMTALSLADMIAAYVNKKEKAAEGKDA